MSVALTTADRSFQFGDGLFTTMQVKDGNIQLWPLHLARLQQGVRRLQITEPDWQQLETQLQKSVTAPHQVLKVVISRGNGGRGYSPSGINIPGIYITTAAMPDYQQWQQQGITLGMAKLKLAVQPLLAGLKHTSRLEQVLLKQELEASGYQELLVLDQQNYVTEVSAANVFFFRDGQWYTPALERCGVTGVMRQHILLQRPDIQQINWQQEDLNNIEAIAVTNALMGIIAVSRFGERNLSATPVLALRKQVLC
ncbi:aminodeoxychorismate lyase [Chromatiaceae bacterium AAb-1]|nr:aminodeoxychorismate lyase [Chromatiaceae bacterium AAb-1]